MCSELISHGCFVDGLSLVGRYDLSTGKYNGVYFVVSLKTAEKIGLSHPQPC
jgi:hypothetical protein